MELIKDNFLLTTDKSKHLYQSIQNVPIYDFHCHLSPKEIYEDKNFSNITKLWLSHDHYKWRLMRAYGIDESLITGNGDDYEKFKAFMDMLPKTIMNSMYHWCYLELARYFNYYEPVQHTTPEKLYNYLNAKLQEPSYSPRQLIEQSNVKVICTTDDPCDNLKYHQLIKEDSTFNVSVHPTFRPDSYVTLNEKTIHTSIEKLNNATDQRIQTLDDYINALLIRIEYFHHHGARSSDQSFSEVILTGLEKEKAESYFSSLKLGESLDSQSLKLLSGYILTELSKAYKKHGWVMQLHLGPLRNNNSIQLTNIGKDAGFDSIGDPLNAKELNALLDHLNVNDALSNTIIYPNNANDHLMVQATAGNFTSNKVKVQLGAAWWYNDTKEGMKQHLIDYANVGLLSQFVGMLTDSRSLLSYSRHEYFRRILCQLLGKLVEEGEIEDNQELLTGILKDICFNNAVRLFNIENIEEVK
ncbi:glucuronate isomerase [Priestia endophytica]|uniref:Uronate isomerase n=1 Tax=Priestia endophytica TaxID=135735 RepID=A0AAX1QA57_9BACI|nr:glucuronate isomerase [Priestia endophytica]RAS78691.1 glucuronate isomerase [Priestia endophytica]RAS85446.1 glucuronate isomerase [Priestia endophytica]